jgi:SPP1 gp7 family putative phage head morphogenesis protein
VEEFMKWLESQVEKGILDVRVFQQVGSGINQAWTNLYIADSYKRGVLRARYELKKAGYPVPTMEATGGIGSWMSLPFHVDRLGLIFTRTYSDLKGITSNMDMQISRVLAQGIADGDGPRLIARNLLKIINGGGGDLSLTDKLGRFIDAKTRAMMLARTETIRSFHIATVNEYRNWGVIGVNVMAEFRTAGDDRVCEKCSSLEGQVFTLEEIEPLIPQHPLCRCISLPVIIEDNVKLKKK